MLMSAHYPLRGLDYPCLHIAIGRYEPILTLKLFTLTKAVCLPTSVVTRDNTSHLFYFSSRMENNRAGALRVKLIVEVQEIGLGGIPLVMAVLILLD